MWISPSPKGHILATGRDERGRKQYIYHPQWNAVRDQRKFDKLLLFGEALPLIREHTDQDLRRHGLGREKVIALVVRLLETTLIRVGNEEYRRNNESFGLTTLRDAVTVEGAMVKFTFNKARTTRIRSSPARPSPRQSCRALRDIPRPGVFQYLDDDDSASDRLGRRQRLSARDHLAKFDRQGFSHLGGTSSPSCRARDRPAQAKP